MASEDADSMDDLFRGTEEEVERMHASVSSMYCELNHTLLVAYAKRWLHDGTGLMASKSVSVALVDCGMFIDASRNSGGDAGIKIRPTNEELLSMSPEFDHRWSTYFANAPDKPAMLMLPTAWWVHSF